MSSNYSECLQSWKLIFLNAVLRNFTHLWLSPKPRPFLNLKVSYSGPFLRMFGKNRNAATYFRNCWHVCNNNDQLISYNQIQFRSHMMINYNYAGRLSQSTKPCKILNITADMYYCNSLFIVKRSQLRTTLNVSHG